MVSDFYVLAAIERQGVDPERAVGEVRAFLAELRQRSDRPDPVFEFSRRALRAHCAGDPMDAVWVAALSAYETYVEFKTITRSVVAGG
jgi:hypothetical protein